MPVDPSERRTTSSRTAIHGLEYTCLLSTVSTVISVPRSGHQEAMPHPTSEAQPASPFGGTAGDGYRFAGRGVITIREEIVRNGLYSAGHDRDGNGLASGRWYCDGMVRRAFADPGCCAGRADRRAAGRDRGRRARDRHTC